MMNQASPLPAEMDHLDMEAVARVAREAELQDIYLLRADVSRLGPEPIQGRLVLDFNCQSRLLEERGEDRLLSVACDFSLAARKEGESPEEVMHVEATFLVSYTFPEGKEFTPEEVHQFARINPLYNAWAYWREFVHSMTARMGLPPLLVPLLKIGPRKTPAPDDKKGRLRRRQSSSSG